MKMPCFPVTLSARTGTREQFLIGETGFMFSRVRQPSPDVVHGSKSELPLTARSVLNAQSGFLDFEGLVEADVRKSADGKRQMGWMLGRSAAGLVSVVITDESECVAQRLIDDLTFAVNEAKRYCASGAVLFVQQESDGKCRCQSALRSVLKVAAIESDLLYKYGDAAELPTWFAYLSPLKE
ncbi:hypothetical protein [Paraburkholderia tropica]|uniref:hypothetical protein n=1 Tax=Paraburkholderia tropica TaxID=92647 RepID=UPI002AB6B61C|nr:hypothetical protein [Paraburkholderia tropica]